MKKPTWRDLISIVLQEAKDIFILQEEYFNNSSNKKISKQPVVQDKIAKPTIVQDKIAKPSILQDIVESNLKQSKMFEKLVFTKDFEELEVFENDENENVDIINDIMDPCILEEILEPCSQIDNPPPLISFVTLNRFGLTIRNLNKILASNEDFEMHIIDNNSKDNTWEYIKSLKDKRIKSKTRFKINRGPIYVLNYNLRKRKPNQYFFTIDSDVYIKSENWISKYMEVFNAFPEVGLLGIMRDNPYPRFMPPIIPKVKGDVSYLQLKNAEIDVIMDFIPGCLQALRPELIKEIGYWSEEIGYGDAELSPRITHYTSFKAGFVTTVEIDMTQYIGCNECLAKKSCTLSKSVKTCFMLSRRSNHNQSFAKKFKWKYLQAFKELAEGKRTAYCGSILDPESIKNHLYHSSWAVENFEHYIKNSN